jgi:hypothetical protein
MSLKWDQLLWNTTFYSEFTGSSIDGPRKSPVHGGELSFPSLGRKLEHSAATTLVGRSRGVLRPETTGTI